MEFNIVLNWSELSPATRYLPPATRGKDPFNDFHSLNRNITLQTSSSSTSLLGLKAFYVCSQPIICAEYC